MNDNQIIEAIRKATGGTFVNGPAMSTCMGWVENFDEQGRLLTADPNFRESVISIDNKEYRLFRRGWYAVIVKSEYTEKTRNRYLSMFSLPKEVMVGGEIIDLRPDYVKEYEENLKINEK